MSEKRNLAGLTVGALGLLAAIVLVAWAMQMLVGG